MRVTTIAYGKTFRPLPGSRIGRQQFVRLCECGCGEPTTIARLTEDGNIRGQPRRYVPGHHYRVRRTRPAADRFWEKVNKESGRAFQGTACWEWTGALNFPGGYGVFGTKHGIVLAHRYAYAVAVGPIPEAHDIHHRCENRLCCNPLHLAALTRRDHAHQPGHKPAVQVARSHCPHGHPYSAENTYVYRGKRSCKQCNVERARARREKEVVA